MAKNQAGTIVVGQAGAVNAAPAGHLAIKAEVSCARQARRVAGKRERL